MVDRYEYRKHHTHLYPVGVAEVDSSGSTMAVVEVDSAVVIVALEEIETSMLQETR